MDIGTHNGSAGDGEEDAVRVGGTYHIIFDASYPTSAALASLGNLKQKPCCDMIANCYLQFWMLI